MTGQNGRRSNHSVSKLSHVVRVAVVLATLTSALDGLSLRAQDVAILWDVSGSIQDLMGVPPYPADLRRSVASLVLGREIASGMWNLTLPGSKPPELMRVIDHSNPLAGQGNHVVVLRFGRFERQRYPTLPYFESVDLPVSDLSQLETQMLGAFPETTNEGYTNKDLAMAAVSRYLYDQGSKIWFLVMISDFNEDHIEKLTASEMQVVDDFIAGRLADRSAPIIMRWAKNPSLQLRVEVDRRRDTGQGPSLLAPRVISIEPIVPKVNAKLKAGERPTFFWKWNNETAPDSFSLVVTRIGTGGSVLRKETQGTSLTADGPFKSGSYSWQVFAKTSTGSISSLPVRFQVEGDENLSWLLMLVVAIFATLAAIWYKNNRRRIGGSTQ